MIHFVLGLNNSIGGDEDSPGLLTPRGTAPKVSEASGTADKVFESVEVSKIATFARWKQTNPRRIFYH